MDDRNVDGNKLARFRVAVRKGTKNINDVTKVIRGYFECRELSVPKIDIETVARTKDKLVVFLTELINIPGICEDLKRWALDLLAPQNNILFANVKTTSEKGSEND